MLFWDTSHLLALELANDSRHAAALSHWQSLSAAMPPLLTTSFVVDETVTFLNSRGLHAKAVQVGNGLLHSPSVEIVHVEEPLFQDGWAYFQQHHDKQYSLTDCISFIVMHRRGISTALTFDHHFAQAGFQTLP